MGIARGTIRLLLEEHRRHPFTGCSILQLGRSTVYCTRRELARWAAWHDVRLAPVAEPRLSHDPRLARQGCLDDRTFFSSLGFAEVRSCDIADWEGADYLFDLNRPAPEELHGRFDVVFETGTSVQVFDLPELLHNVHRLLAPGGRAIHAAVPSNNHVDLGFYMACPTLFADYYAANGYSLDAQYLCEYVPYWHAARLHSEPWKIYRYTPGSLDAASYGRFGGRQVAVFAVATKAEGATGGVVPQLGQYRRSWERYADRAAHPAAPAGELARVGRLEGLLRRHPALARATRPAKWLVERLHRLRPGPMPPLVARY
ncbi:MAG TPA: hypothetical protein VMT16_09650 [Thermoanaerobaculia bacterium]|nr:hypothetical protein [Thermoanaerobaculia bacterium]